MNDLKEIVKKAIAEKPEHKWDIIDAYQIVLCEIEDGESIDNEIDLFNDYINSLI